MKDLKHEGVELMPVEQHGCVGCYFRKHLECLENDIVCRERIDGEWIEFVYIEKINDNEKRVNI